MEPLERTKISDIVTQSVEQYIIDNKLKNGDKLPSQMQLSKNLQVGSRSVREAIKALESKGMVEIIQGKGVFVKNNNLDYFLETLMGNFAFHFPNHINLFIDLSKTRKIIESQIIYDIAENPPEGLIPRLAKVLEDSAKLAEEKDIEAYNLFDMEFHRLIIQASKNRIINYFYKYLSELIFKSFSKTGYVLGSLSDSLQEHRQMLQMIIGRNADGAKKLMEVHLSRTLEKLEAMKEG